MTEKTPNHITSLKYQAWEYWGKAKHILDEAYTSKYLYSWAKPSQTTKIFENAYPVETK